MTSRGPLPGCLRFLRRAGAVDLMGIEPIASHLQSVSVPQYEALLVDPEGIEPSTSPMPWEHSPAELRAHSLQWSRKESNLRFWLVMPALYH